MRTPAPSSLVECLRDAEVHHRARGRFELADATRQIADATETHGLKAPSCCAPLRGSSVAIDAEIEGNR